MKFLRMQCATKDVTFIKLVKALASSKRLAYLILVCPKGPAVLLTLALNNINHLLDRLFGSDNPFNFPG